MSRPSARLAVSGVTLDAVVQALDAVLSRDGYEPFDAARVPPRYPELKREFVRVALGRPDADGIVGVRLPDWDRAFAWALHLSAALPAATVVAIVTPPEEAERWKAYRNGELVLKVGHDPDNELFYNPAVADQAAVTAFLASFSASGRLPGPAAAEEPRLYISRRSRLYLES